MNRFEQGLALLESYAGSTLRPGVPADDALITLLVWVAFSDGHLSPEEHALLQRLLGLSADETASYAARIRSRPVDLDAIAAALDSDDRRWAALRFAGRMAGSDTTIAPGERSLLERLAQALNLGPDAVLTVLRESQGPRPERLDAAQLRSTVNALAWDVVGLDDGALQSPDLLAVVPDGARPVLRIGLDQVEVIGLFEEGLVARFLEGVAFVRWREVVAAMGGAGVESSARLLTDTGRIWSVVDSRLGALRLLVDRLYRDKPTAGRPVRVERVVPDETWDDSSA
jgi:tellurite resistance protein